MERRTALKLMGAATAMAGAGLITGRASAAEKPTIALIPGLTADGFYITMHKGAEAAAKAVGAELVYQGAAEWNVSLQVPILDAIIAKKPGAIMIAPVDKTQLIKPLRKAFDAGITVVCVDTFIGNGVFQTGSGDADFPISLRRVRQRSRRPHGGARAGESDRRQGQGLCLQRQARRLDHRPARRGLQAGDEGPPEH